MKTLCKKFILCFILLLAAFLRLYRIEDYMTFLGDEGRDVLVVYNILHGHLTFLGPTSSVGGFFLGPIYYYFMAPFLLVFQYNPVGPAIMVSLFGILTVWFVYKIGKEFFNEITGLIAASLYAISPLVIAYSRSSWNPNLMPFFTLSTLYVLYKGIERKNMWNIFFCGFLLGILMQLHYLATFVGVIIGIYILVTANIMYRSKPVQVKKIITEVIKKYTFIFSGFLVGLSPFLTFEVRHGFPNIISIFSFVFHSQGVSSGINGWETVLNVFFRLFGRLITTFPPPEQVSLQAHINIFFWYIVTCILAITSIVHFLFQYRKNAFSFLRFYLLFSWFIIGIFLFGFYKKTIYDYYLGFLFPLPFLFVGYFISSLVQKKWYLKIGGVVIFSILFAINIEAMPFRYPPNRQLNQVKTISQFVLDKTNGKPYNFALITRGNSDYAYRYFFTIWGRSPVTILNFQIDPRRTSVTDQLLVVCEIQDCAPLGNSLWEVAGFGRAEIAGKWPISVVQVYRLVHFHEQSPVKNRKN
jgi:4-amino-4-deoxy-L-arabinose transferase-like glycosyltransferase